MAGFGAFGFLLKLLLTAASFGNGFQRPEKNQRTGASSSHQAPTLIISMMLDAPYQAMTERTGYQVTRVGQLAEQAQVPQHPLGSSSETTRVQATSWR